MPKPALRPLLLAPVAIAPLLLALLLLVGARSEAARDELKTGEMAPDWILTSEHGEQVSFYEDSAGRPAVLLFWTSWCSQCTELMPELEKLRADLAAQKIRFYALNIWEDAERVEEDEKTERMDERGFNFTSLLNADLVAKRYNVRNAPGVFLVDPDKTIRYIRPNGSSTAEVMQNLRAALPVEG